MYIDLNHNFTPQKMNELHQIVEVLKTLEPTVEKLMADHRKNSRRWMPHEVVPWGMGRDFTDEPWKPEDALLRPDCVMAFETNLLTEDNLPYYHAQIALMVDPKSVWGEWNRLWTAEEGGHGCAMRDYLYLSRSMDPNQIERNRHMIMETGFERFFDNPLEVFAYTSAQELATRISHLRAGQRADEPIALKLLTLIARDENFHYIFYRGVMEEALKLAPELCLRAIANQLYSFEMPGTGMTDFELRQALIADAGIYGAREHRDLVIKPLLKFWRLDLLTDLSPAAEKYRDKIMRLERLLDRLVERQDRKAPKSHM